MSHFLKNIPASLLDVSYPVMEHFYTLQGEGTHTGSAAYFIRLAGCDVNCPWCDVKESWEAENHPILTVKELVEAVSQHQNEIVVITGGEPLLHDLSALTSVLKDLGKKIHIETSGSSPLSGTVDWVTLSPKRFKKPVDSIYINSSELKVVIQREQDFRWAEQHASLCPQSTVLFLQPEWETPESVKLILDYIAEHPKWRLSLQTHKFIHIP